MIQFFGMNFRSYFNSTAAIAQLGERQTEDLKVPGSIPGLGTLLCIMLMEVAFVKHSKNSTLKCESVGQFSLELIH